jgi:predicted RNase H-like HicB family nuclease
MKKSFTVVVERDPESNWLVGEVVELPGCYTQAPDLPMLEVNIREAIAAYLKTVEPEEPLPDFVGTWRVEVAARNEGGSIIVIPDHGSQVIVRSLLRKILVIWALALQSIIGCLTSCEAQHVHKGVILKPHLQVKNLESVLSARFTDPSHIQVFWVHTSLQAMARYSFLPSFLTFSPAETIYHRFSSTDSWIKFNSGSPWPFPPDTILL